MIEAFVFVIGLIIGSFLNVCIWRLPRNESIVSPASHCPKCSAAIAPYDNIPVVSWLFLRAKCRKCRAAVSWRYPLVELLSAAAGTAAFVRFGSTPYGVMAAVILWALIVVTFIDFDHQIIPDEISLGGIVLGAVFSVIFPAWHEADSWKGGLAGSVIGLLAGGGLLYALGTLGEWIFKKEAMGGGDVKLLAAIGSLLGWKGVLVTVFFGSLVGAVVGIAARLIRGSERIPFGPYLAMGAGVALFWGNNIVSWYLQTMIKY